MAAKRRKRRKKDDRVELHQVAWGIVKDHDPNDGTEMLVERSLRTGIDLALDALEAEMAERLPGFRWDFYAAIDAIQRHTGHRHSRKVKQP